jgi:hypothetical protein
MRRATAFAIVSIVSVCVGWHFGEASTARAQSNGISAVSVVGEEGTRLFIVRDGQLMDCRWTAGSDHLSLHPSADGFLCSQIVIKN